MPPQQMHTIRLPKGQVTFKLARCQATWLEIIQVAICGLTPRKVAVTVTRRLSYIGQSTCYLILALGRPSYTRPHQVSFHLQPLSPT